MDIAILEQYRQDDRVVTNYVHPHSLYQSSMPLEPIHRPTIGPTSIVVDDAVQKCFPIPGTQLLSALDYGSSMWAKPAKLIVRLPNGSERHYFLKVIPNKDLDYDDPLPEIMCRGEFESLKAIHSFMPKFVPEPYDWGRLSTELGCFLLTEFRSVGQQPSDPNKLGKRLAELHQRSVSPTGNFGFHATTCHGNLPQDVNRWESSWCVLFSRILRRAMTLDDEKHETTGEYAAVRQLLFDKVIPRLLEPLQSGGRSIKPCLVHGDAWDENCADDMDTGEPFVFDAGSFYGHNEYEVGFWRPPRFRLSAKRYARAYKKHFPMSEPVEDWDDRNLLYSIRLNVSCSTLIPASGQRVFVLEDMKTLCRKHFPQEMKVIEVQTMASMNSLASASPSDNEEDEDEETDSEMADDEANHNEQCRLDDYEVIHSHDAFTKR